MMVCLVGAIICRSATSSSSITGNGCRCSADAAIATPPSAAVSREKMLALLVAGGRADPVVRAGLAVAYGCSRNTPAQLTAVPDRPPLRSPAAKGITRAGDRRNRARRRRGTPWPPGPCPMSTTAHRTCRRSHVSRRADRLPAATRVGPDGVPTGYPQHGRRRHGAPRRSTGKMHRPGHRSRPIDHWAVPGGPTGSTGRACRRWSHC
jgi:hypothetical protein